jgi:hypothetical protein
MWTELTAIVENRYRAGSQSRQYTADALTMLYGALTNCREAFAHYRDESSDLNLAKSACAMDGLLSVLQNLQPGLALFEPALAAHLDRHLLQRDGHAATPRERLREQVELVRYLVGREAQESEVLPTELGDFDAARNALARIIHASFSCDELFASVSSFAAQR